MSTVVSNASSYITPAAFLQRYDARSVGDLCSDNDTRVSAAALLTDANLQAALDDAAGMIEMACLLGARYTPTDLASLTGVSQKALYRINADLAMGLLNQRRPDKSKGLMPAFDSALKLLDALAKGERIFGLQEVMDAGLVESIVETAAIVESRNMVTEMADRYFGRRSNRNNG